MKYFLLLGLLFGCAQSQAQEAMDDDFNFDTPSTRPAAEPIEDAPPSPPSPARPKVKKLPFCKKVLVADAGYAVCFPRKKGACFCLANP